MINVLSKETIDKIAAGEVVERPKSVVKELLENAVDARASAVTVEIKEGGISFIRVTDNGSGIEKGEVPKAFLRHATSKIQSAEDLVHIMSLGFRGEALSSIAAVSRMELITKTRAELTGIRYLIEGGVEKEAEEIGAPDGTTILVRNLFFNTPVRKKFLKQPQTEGGYISDLMEHMAMAHPEISFKYINNGQTRFHTSGNGKLEEIIYRIYGRDISNALVPIDVEENGIRMYGFLGKPEINRANRNFEIYFVNGRFIKSAMIGRAIEEGYKKYVMQHKFPFAVLHFEIASQEIDVNVHPTKMEVRFTNQQKLYDFIAGNILAALHRIELIPKVVLESVREEAERKIPAGAVPEPFETGRAQREGEIGSRFSAAADSSQKRVAEKIPYTADKDTFFEDNRSLSKPEENRENGENAGKMQEVLQKPETTRVIGMEDSGKSHEYAKEHANVIKASEHIFVEKPVFVEKSAFNENPEFNEKSVFNENPVINEKEGVWGKPEQMNFFEEKMLTKEARSEYDIVGQIFDTYWLVAFHDKLFIIDQHAAHEKVKYERFMRQLEERQIQSQMINPPVIITLTGREENVLREYRKTFEEIGFEIEAFGGNEYAVRSVPTDLYGCSENELFKEMLDELANGPVKGAPSIIRQRIATMACKSAVKGNMKFDRSGIEALIDQLLALEDPYHCPHGRPTIISMSRYELEKKFKRII